MRGQQPSKFTASLPLVFESAECQMFCTKGNDGGDVRMIINAALPRTINSQRLK
jgi:hypothetical protein